MASFVPESLSAYRRRLRAARPRDVSLAQLITIRWDDLTRLERRAHRLREELQGLYVEQDEQRRNP